MSGARPLFRSPQFGDGITSEAIEESGLNVFMFAFSRGAGSARWRFESTLSEISDMGTLQNKGANNNTDSPDHYSFMTGAAQSHGMPLPQFSPGVCGTHQ